MHIYIIYFLDFLNNNILIWTLHFTVLSQWKCTMVIGVFVYFSVLFWKVNMKKTKTTRHQSAGRKAIRPIERQKMRPWLYNLLLNHDVPSLQWEVKREGLFRIAWRHAARQGWNPREDADLFERWARHTGV